MTGLGQLVSNKGTRNTRTDNDNIKLGVFEDRSHDCLPRASLIDSVMSLEHSPSSAAGPQESWVHGHR